MPLPSPSSPISRSTGAIVAALALSTLSIGVTVSPAPAQAAGAAPYYDVQLAEPAAKATAIAGGVVWYCEGTSCVARKGGSQPWIMCKHLVREHGKVTRFTYSGKELEADKLAKCNGE